MQVMLERHTLYYRIQHASNYVVFVCVLQYFTGYQIVATQLDMHLIG